MAYDDTKITGGTLTAAEYNAFVTEMKTRADTSSGAGVPSSTPTQLGEIYVDTDNDNIYMAESLTSSTSWVQVDASAGSSDVVDDTTPQLGGNLDLNGKGFTEELTAGELLAAGDLVYLKDDGKMWKADASADSTADTLLAVSLDTPAADATGTFLLHGKYTTTGLTAGSPYYVSETGGAFTATAPTTTASVVRIVGYALSTTVLYVKPDGTYVENS